MLELIANLSLKWMLCILSFRYLYALILRTESMKSSQKNKLETRNNVLYCIVLYCIVLYCIVLYCIVLYCVIVRNNCCKTIPISLFLSNLKFLLAFVAPGVHQL
jgi:hypothetical protein